MWEEIGGERRFYNLNKQGKGGVFLFDKSEKKRFIIKFV